MEMKSFFGKFLSASSANLKFELDLLKECSNQAEHDSRMQAIHELYFKEGSKVILAFKDADRYMECLSQAHIQLLVEYCNYII